VAPKIFSGQVSLTMQEKINLPPCKVYIMEITTKESRKTFTVSVNLPATGSEEEKIRFNSIQERFQEQYEKVFPDKLAPRTVVIIPSLTLDREILSKVKGFLHYEERMLCLLMLLRLPLTKIVYVTSIPVANVIIDYYPAPFTRRYG
jgi:hypothetical protein